MHTERSTKSSRSSLNLPTQDESNRQHATVPLLAPQKEAVPEKAPRKKLVPSRSAKALKRQAARLGWWWETGAVFVSLVCMSLIVAVLFRMDGRPLRTWTLPIQPNSLVAIFSTLTKSALLVPIAESIGQLKWDYFERPRNIQHFQDFDEASRGPWGAFVFLWKTKGTAYLAGFGALITVLMLGFEPFTQQIIEVYSQDTVRSDSAGYFTSTNTFVNVTLSDVTWELSDGMAVPIFNNNRGS
jgi:hypothetical protein